MKKLLRNNGLSLVLLAIFLVLLVLHSVFGHAHYNDEEREHDQPTISYGEYLTTGAFWESIGENWESEFLQMAAFVIIATHLFQKGSSESKDPDEKEPVDEPPEKHRNDPEAPWPVRRGGFALAIYKHSLSLALFLLFLISFVIHAVGGLEDYNDERIEHGKSSISMTEYLASSRFWFESMQNWQSEFLAILSIVVLSIFLREYASPQSKPVAAPHSDTGSG